MRLWMCVGMEPPPSIARADKLRSGQLRGRIRTGAKTATKDQERDYLDRFERLAQDPSPLVPVWRGDGADPFAKLRSRLERVRARRASPFWLKWYGRGKRLDNAYAQTLTVLQGGKIPSFASFKFRGRDVKFVLRGQGLRDKLMAVQNHEDSDVRLLGYLDFARKNDVLLISLPDEFAAFPGRDGLPAPVLTAILHEVGLETPPGGATGCPHTAEDRVRLRYDLKKLKASVTVCQPCLQRLDGEFEALLDSCILAPGGRLTVDRSVEGSESRVQPPDAKPELVQMTEAASQDALEKSKNYTGITDADLITWTQEALAKRLEERKGGYLLVGDDLWLADYETAAQRYGESDVDRRVLAAAFRLEPPRLRTGEPSLQRLLEPAWPKHGAELLRGAGGDTLDAADLDELARQRPADAVRALERRIRTEARFSEFPKLLGLPEPLRWIHDLFKAHRTGDEALFKLRLADGVRSPELKPVALAVARAFLQSAPIEWQYAPHEKDQALFWEPMARTLAMATPQTYVASLRAFADAMNLPAPVAR